ncbi:uncharacterized protein BDW43DRAFT_274623 [Aspergillus alliaceus]|uniref:uncharacterized protein n=1 Tax=Petromyces alliaceus TaxID=209559 RepID=UPI0012A674A5|nr:uncharacterized protein BDW43DRAFT_274623 [Aspergillus alliaceus]KAB8234242.1 hypothetical protein BDW43DRAFT_274623 [Aspergillus alliaceus]
MQRSRNSHPHDGRLSKLEVNAERGKPDIASRAKTVEAVLDTTKASQLFRSRATHGQPNNANGN